MYNSPLNLSDPPFINNKDLNNFIFLKNYKNLVSKILHAITEGKNFVLITGESGVGKTLLIDYLISHLPPSVFPVALRATETESLEIMSEVAKGLHMPVSQDPFFELHELEDKLRALHKQQKQLVLIIDDAHLLSVLNLSEIKLLRIMEINDTKLVSVILVGQEDPHSQTDIFETNNILQDIELKLKLEPLDQSDIIDYIDNRLRFVGYNFDSCFEGDCGDLLYNMSGGVPRSINRICDAILLSGMTKEVKKISRANLTNIFEFKPTESRFAQDHRGVGKIWVSLGIGVILLAGALIVFRGVLRNRLQPVIASPSLSTSAPQDQGSAETKVNRSSPQDKSQQVIPQEKPSDRSPPAGEAVTLSNQVPAAPVMASKRETPTSQPEEPAPESRWVVRSNDNLTKIVRGHYGNDEHIGLEAVILANPDISNGDFITPGQILYLPKINSTTGEIELPDRSLYTLYGIYSSAASLTNDLAWLAKRDIRYEVRKIRGPNGLILNHVFLGGYKGSLDLKEAKGRVQSRAIEGRGQLPLPQ